MLKFYPPASRDPDPTGDPQQLEQALTGSSALVPPILARANGVVLDIGPGSGTQIPFFRATSSSIQTIYGAEPCQNLHSQLQARIDAAGLNGKYRIVHCSAEKESLVPAMEKIGLLADARDVKGVFDSIVCTRVLCSVPRPQETIEGLYKLLKPGGKLLVCEHVVNPWTTKKGSIISRGFQVLYTMLGWSFFMGDCHMNRDTGKFLREVAKADGGWESVELEPHFGWSTLPYVSGELVKKNV